MSIFNKAGKREVECLLRLKSPEMQPLLAFLDNLLTDSYESLLRAEGSHLLRLQGRAEVVKDLLDAVENAATTLDRLRK